MRAVGTGACALFVAGLLAAVALAQVVRPGGFELAYSKFAMVQNKSVQEDLKLSPDQLTKIAELVEKQRQFSKDPPKDQAEQFRKLRELSQANEKTAADLLTPEQAKRLKQIALQQQGDRAFYLVSVVAALDLSEQQKVLLRDIQQDAARLMRDLYQAAGNDFREAQKELAEQRRVVLAVMTAILTPEQQKTWRELTGVPFKGDLIPGGGFFGGTNSVTLPAVQSAPGKADPSNAVSKPDAVDPELMKKAAAARAVGERAAGALAAYDAFVQSRTAAVQKVLATAAEATIALARASTAKEEAEKALVRLGTEMPQARAAAEKLVAEKTTAARTAADRVAAVRRTVEMTLAARDAAEKQFAERGAVLQVALNEAAATEAAALGGLAPLDVRSWDHGKARHLLVRAGFGGTPDEVARLHALGLYRAVDSLVNYAGQSALALPFDAAQPERPTADEKFRTPQEVQVLTYRRRAADTAQVSRLRQWWFQRMIQSPRPLQEKLTLFWHGHFATEQRIVQNSYAIYRQNELFREYAAGNFGSLLFGIVHDAAMLRYLDNNTNVQGKPNENLAREIMELFSMGEGQGYTEKDIMEGARALTGYTFDPYSSQFRFHQGQHDAGTKTIFGKTGAFSGDDFVELILQQPATSRFIASKLFVFFASDRPDREVVERLASVLRRSDYELRPVLRNLFLSEEFYGPRTLGTQVKSPVQLIVGLHRELGRKEVNYQGLEFAVRSMGQDLFDPPNVKGWEGGRNWINANVLLTRYNQVASLVERPTFVAGPQPRQVQLDVVALLEGQEFKTSAEVVDYLVRRHLAVPLAEAKRKELIAYLNDLPPSSQWTQRRNEVNARLWGLLVLLLASPEYQMT